MMDWKKKMIGYLLKIWIRSLFGSAPKPSRDSLESELNILNFEKEEKRKVLYNSKFLNDNVWEDDAII